MRPTFMCFSGSPREGEGLRPSPPVKASLRERGKGGGLETRTNEGGRETTIDLDAVASRFTHKNPVLVIHRHTGRPPEVLFPFQSPGALPLCPHLCIGVEF